MRYSKEKLLPKRKLLFNLIKGCFWGTIAIAVAIWFMSMMFKVNPFYEYLLMSEGVSVSGFITNTGEDIEEGERGQALYYYHYTYTFTTTNGKSVESSWSSKGRLREEFIDLVDPYPTTIVYLRDNPDINEIKENLSESMIEFILRKVALGLLLLTLFCSIGLLMIKGAIKDYLKGIREHKLIAS